jgi:hypothetical protein
MKVKFENSQELNDLQISLIEKKLLCEIPIDLAEFLRAYSNAIPSINKKPCVFKTVHSDGWEQSNFIERIISMEGIILELDDRSTLELYVNSFNLSRDFVEIEYLLPFALPANGILYYAVGGNHTGRIYIADNGDFGILIQAIDFKSFWDSVYEG